MGVGAGLGDHYAFRDSFDTQGGIVACCYQEVFAGAGCEVVSLAQAAQWVDPKDYDVYAWCQRKRWQGTLQDAYRELYRDLAARFQ
jgi:hypothetical protein